jgi:hypothetical protein
LRINGVHDKYAVGNSSMLLCFSENTHFSFSCTSSKFHSMWKNSKSNKNQIDVTVQYLILVMTRGYFTNFYSICNLWGFFSSTLTKPPLYFSILNQSFVVKNTWETYITPMVDPMQNVYSFYHSFMRIFIFLLNSSVRVRGRRIMKYAVKMLNRE